jgi:selenocysteine-specific elongation factor
VPLIGTAGHVDHGKSTLVEALTGRDPDRWAEEKRRGLTIDLGFSWMKFNSGREVSFVDVPGHERFLKNMLAGVESIDVALLVVAADEGWKPQSEEHLAVLDLLEVGRGLVALTKIDLVDAATVEVATEEVVSKLAGSSLAGVPVVPVSARTGTGLAALIDALDVATRHEPVDSDRPRLWVDRSFSIAGAGTVVTGSLLDGSLTVDQEVVVYPSGIVSRIRSLQRHEQDLTMAGPGYRVAASLTGLGKADVPRGSMLGVGGQWLLSTRFSARIKLARYLDRFPDKGAFHLHLGTGEHPVRVRVVEEDVALIQTRESLPITSGDRFIIRDSGRRLVVAGGRVLDPDPPRGGSKIMLGQLIDPDSGLDSVATSLLELRGVDDLGRLTAHSGGGRPIGAIEVGATLVEADRFRAMQLEARVMAAAYHDDHPLRPGLPLATLAGGLGVPAEVADRIVEEDEGLQRSGPHVVVAGRRVEVDQETADRWAAARKALSASLMVPASDDLGLGPEQIHLLIREGELIRISPSLVYLPAQMEEIITGLRILDSPFTVADFRDATGLSRKYAIPLLEWADREGLTIRKGDMRRLR